MKVIIARPHNGYTPGDEVEVSDARALYWLRCGVAKVGEPSKEEIDSKLKSTLKKSKKKEK